MRWDCEQRWWRCSGIEKASWSVAADRSGIGSVREAREKSVVDADGGHYLQRLLLDCENLPWGFRETTLNWTK
jgi:hypothetical protein